MARFWRIKEAEQAKDYSLMPKRLPLAIRRNSSRFSRYSSAS
jgi:hypothetical protein